MTSDSLNPGPSPETLVRWIAVSGEDEFVDAKGPMAWDGAEGSASLAKDIAAFANSRDGGVIVIGKAEVDGGGFKCEGLAPARNRSRGSWSKMLGKHGTS